MSYVDPMYPNNLSVGPILTSADKVNARFDDSKTAADAAKASALSALDQLINLLKGYHDIDTDTALDPVDFTAATDITQYLSERPVNPITEADYKAITDAIPSDKDLTYTDDTAKGFMTELWKLSTALQNAIDGTQDWSLGTLIEQQMQDKEQERDSLILEDAKAKAEGNWSKRRFARPGAGFFSDTVRLDTEYANKQLDKSRDIAEKSRTFRIQAAMNGWKELNQLISTVASYDSNIYERKLKAASKVLDVVLEKLRAIIEAVKAKAETYSAESQGYAAFITAVGKIVDTQVAVINAKVNYSKAEADVDIENTKAAIQQAQFKYQAGITEMDNIAKICAQMMAAAWSAVSAQAQIHAGFSSSVQTQASATEIHTVSS